MKIATTGTSGSGKTTLNLWIAKEFGLKHISSSAGDLLTDTDKETLKNLYAYDGGAGHAGVIGKSAIDFSFGFSFQTMLQTRRAEMIRDNHHFITDRSPIDNFTYFVNQCGMHKEFTNEMAMSFLKDCLKAWVKLTHVIYIKAVQPDMEVEDNGSRIANGFYQSAIDTQFQLWFDKFNLIKRNTLEGNGPRVLIIDYWDLEKRKKNIYQFLRNL